MRLADNVLIIYRYLETRGTYAKERLLDDKPILSERKTIISPYMTMKRNLMPDRVRDGRDCAVPW